MISSSIRLVLVRYTCDIIKYIYGKHQVSEWLVRCRCLLTRFTRLVLIYAGSKVWFVLANGTQDSLTASQPESGVYSSCLPTPRLSALRAAAPLHNDGQRLQLADATQDSLGGTCRRTQDSLGGRSMVALRLRTMAPQLANDGYVSCTSHRAPAAGIQGQVVVTDLAGSAQCLLSWQMVATSCTSAVLADTTQQPDFDVALYAVVGWCIEWV
jgi:hypothetical protein